MDIFDHRRECVANNFGAGSHTTRTIWFVHGFPLPSHRTKHIALRGCERGDRQPASTQHFRVSSHPFAIASKRRAACKRTKERRPKNRPGDDAKCRRGADWPVIMASCSNSTIICILQILRMFPFGILDVSDFQINYFAFLTVFYIYFNIVSKNTIFI